MEKKKGGFPMKENHTNKLKELAKVLGQTRNMHNLVSPVGGVGLMCHVVIRILCGKVH